ncbi:MAG: GtrA family protein [Solirubrobacteraceae bacterium]
MVRPQTLLAPDSGLLGQGVRFALAGGLVALVYLLTTTALAVVAGVPFQIALVIGFCVAIAVHFTLQRMFVWVDHDEFALPVHRQAGRYLPIVGAQYGVTAASTALLPRALGLPTEVVYVVTALLLAGGNFAIFRHGVFHAA